MADALKTLTELLNNNKKKEDASIHPKEFFWDQFLKYIASAILALTVLNISVEFLRGGGVSCFPPSDNEAISAQDLEGRMSYEFGRGQTSYINNYCARSIPKTEYFPIYILVHGLLLIVPHYVWSAIHNGDFDSFFSIVEKLDRLRDSSTGEYDTKNFDRVTKLELEYSGRRIYFTYIFKLVLQLALCTGAIVFSAMYFIDCDFSFSFCCPDDNNCGTSETANNTCPRQITGSIPSEWPLAISVPCVYTSLRILNLVRYADFFLLGVALLLVVFGLVWCCVRHTEQLGHKAIAKFSFHSCLNSDFYVFPSPIFWPVYRCYSDLSQGNDENKKRRRKCVKYFWILTHYPQLYLENLFSPRILNDLDFLLLMLFRADTSHGQVFKDIQINKDLKVLVERDHQLLHLYINVQQDIEDGNYEETHSEPEATANGETENSRSNAVQSAVVVEQHTSGDISQSDEKVTDFHKFFLSDVEDPEMRVFEYFKHHLGNLEYDAEDFSGMRDWIYYFARHFGPRRTEGNLLRNSFAVDISFGTVGFARVLARPFKKVLSLDFHPFYRALEQVAERKDFYTSQTTVRFPHNIFAQDTPKINLVSDELNTCTSGKRHVDFIVVGPLTEESKKVVVNLLMNLLFTLKCIGQEAALLAVRPLKVGSKKLTSRFYKYEPPTQLFKLDSSVYTKLEKDRKEQLREVDECRGVEVMLDRIPCVFEFAVYKYKLLQITSGGTTTPPAQTDKNNSDSRSTPV